MKKWATLSVLLCFFSCLTLSAQQQKIAVVDMQQVFSGYDKTKAIELQLNQQMELYKEYAGKLVQEYQTLRKEFETLREGALNVSLSNAERENRKMRAMEKGEEMKRKEAELKEYNQSRQKQLKERYDKLRNDVIAEIRQVVMNKCILNGWTLVLDKSGASLNDMPLVIYSSPAIDLTKEVLGELNRAYRSGSKEKKTSPEGTVKP